MENAEPVMKFAAALGRLDTMAVGVMSSRFADGKLGRWADDLISYTKHAYELAKAHAKQEIQTRIEQKRSFGLYLPDMDFDVDKDWDWDLADYYKDYLVDLAGVARQDWLARANQTLEDGVREGSTVSDTADQLGSLFPGFSEHRLKTIVRTEGTRVASAARRDIGLAAQQSAFAPTQLIYTGTPDERQTKTCHYGFRHRRPIELSDWRWQYIVLPAHYNCRSLERYGFDWDENDMKVSEWDIHTVTEFLTIQKKEFPNWEPRPLPPIIRI